jgi:hypothetical protein
MDLKETGRENVDWIHVARDRFQWRVFLNTVMSLLVQKRKGREFLLCERLSASRGFRELISEVLNFFFFKIWKQIKVKSGSY